MNAFHRVRIAFDVVVGCRKREKPLAMEDARWFDFGVCILRKKNVALGAGAARGVCGSPRDADIHKYEEAVETSWDASFVQLSARHLNAGIEYLAGDRFVL